MAQYTVEFLLVVTLFGMARAQAPDVTFEIDEELPVATQVGNISEDSRLFPELTNQQKTSLQYGILDQASPQASLFNISRTGGNIYVAKRIDREEFCLTVELCVLKINILASAQFNSKVITVHFTINDINDNAPIFDRNNVVLKVPEGSSLDSVLKMSGANDRDFKPEYKVKNYTLSSFQEVFQLLTSQTLDGSSEIGLKLKQHLDRETQARYEFNITAYDGGMPAQSSTLLVTVEVTDVNDNDPVFSNSTYSITVDGNTSLNKVIAQVSASDKDEGVNALITYDFSSLQKPALEKTFHINSSSGEISVVGPLKSGLREFIVVAQDSGSPRRKTETFVRVNVINTGNTPPLVSVSTLGSSSDNSVVPVLEPAARGLFVAFVTVDDDGGSDDVVCEVSNDVFRMEPVPTKGYKIVLQGAVDRESRATYQLTVICMDRGDPPLNSSASFTVKIEDANDNVPEFSQQRYSRTIKEGKKKDEYVLQVSASDKDAGVNKELTYSIETDYDKYFKIDPNTGILTAVGDLDREAYSVMKFQVFATDKGTPAQTGSAEISIVLEDMNDNAPEFPTKVFKIQTKEEIDGTRIIFNLTAEDADEGANGQIEYFFTGSLDGADGAFTVLQNGSIISSTKLDREERVNYSFSVMARDKGDPPLMSSASVVVEVVDINDNSPSILFPKSQNHTILITTLPETGVVLSRIIAYDDDAGDNGSLRFTIVSGNEDRAFGISETTGEFKITSASRLKNRKHYDVGIIISDRGLPPKFNTTNLRIDVQFDNATEALIRNDKARQEDYIIIVAVVAAVTVIFSTLIIAAICVIFQKDRSSRCKSSPKGAFHNLPAPDALNDEEKVSTVAHETSEFPSYKQQYGLNNLSAPPGGNPNSKDEGKFCQLQLYPEYQNGSKSKAVSFNLNESEIASSSSPRHASPREDLPRFVTFGSPCGRGCEDEMYPQRPSRQGDDVTSDTSGDTTTNDSGRGNSVDDVNFEQIVKGDNSPGLSTRRPSTEFQIPARKLNVSENTGRSSYHVRFAQNSGKVYSSDMPAKDKLSNTCYGPRPMSKSLSMDYVKDRNSAHKGRTTTSSSNGADSRLPHSKLSSFALPRQLSVTSIDDDASTTTSGSYVITPDDIRIDTFVGADVIV